MVSLKSQLARRSVRASYDSDVIGIRAIPPLVLKKEQHFPWDSLPKA